MVFIFYLILNLRQFIALAIIGPFLLSVVVRYGSRLSQRPVILLFFRLVVYALLVIGFMLIANAEQTQSLIQEAQITQSDFSQNPIYTGAKYELSTMDGTPTGILLAMPESVFIALYRPFITENLSIFLIWKWLPLVIPLFVVEKETWPPVSNLIISTKLPLWSILFLYLTG